MAESEADAFMILVAWEGLLNSIALAKNFMYQRGIPGFIKNMLVQTGRQGLHGIGE